MTQPIQVTMRAPVEDDRARLLAWRNLPEISRWMYGDHLITPDEHDHWFDRLATHSGSHYWVIELEGEPVGLANLADISTVHRRASWAYYLASPNVRGKGLGAYVEVFVIEQAFGSFGLSKLCCEVLAENEAVWKMHEAFGFKHEGLYRQHIWKQGRAHDVVALSLLAQDWAGLRQASFARLASRGYQPPGV